jgi:hypothetical protein
MNESIRAGLVAASIIGSIAFTSCTASPPQPPKAANRGIPYGSVADAFAAEKARGDVQISEQAGWIIVSDEPQQTVWSFTASAHPAHPAFVRRSVVRKGDALSVETTVLCEAETSACNKLVSEFQSLNDRMRQDFGSQPRAP